MTSKLPEVGKRYRDKRDNSLVTIIFPEKWKQLLYLGTYDPNKYVAIRDADGINGLIEISHFLNNFKEISIKEDLKEKIY